MRALVPLLLLLLLAGSVRAAEDEGYEETEHRLKTAGIDADMRERIHAAIRRAVQRLRRIQKRSGMVGRDMGTTSLAALALRHAAIPDAREGARIAGKLLLRKARKEMRERTYQAGIMSMLLQAEEAEGADLRFLYEIHGRLGKGPYRADGYWDYRSAGGSGMSNLSTAQFACLGLWAAERAGAPTARRAWSEHLDALVKAQHDDGSWGYASPTVYSSRERILRTYPTGTFMGLANLVLAQHAIADELAAEPERHARVLIARAAAEAALRRHTQWVLGAPGIPGPANRGWSHYTLYALEKACIFLGLEDVGGVSWYREGAQWLLGGQATDGSWREHRARGQGIVPIDAAGDAWRTSFALLFLLRVSESYRPITPRPIDRPKVTTPRVEEPPPAPPTSKRAAPPLKPAQLVLDRIEEALRRKQVTRIARLLDAIRYAARTHRQVRAAGADAEPLWRAWSQRAETLLLRCSSHFLRRGTNDRLLWQAVAVRSLDALGSTHPRVAPELMRKVIAMKRSQAFRSDYELAWYGTALEALRRLDPPGLIAWLRDRVVSGDTEHIWRTSAALAALGGRAVTARGRERQSVLRSVIQKLQPILRRSRGNADIDGLLRDVQVLVQRLAMPSEPDDFPALGSLDLDRDLRAVLAWWRRHRDPADALWRN